MDFSNCARRSFALMGGHRICSTRRAHYERYIQKPNTVTATGILCPCWPWDHERRQVIGRHACPCRRPVSVEYLLQFSKNASRSALSKLAIMSLGFFRARASGYFVCNL
ncbi:hypothetical protein PILCRDRAFT_810933 [Piloderma croceum F 1598]|uniref:Uncharacterized protein n=1 Tax=Piloderma croceum (strain F 1598) TaxID=765440 RepID=A0A0C3BYN0_PILCF|nr:hypothetical protein PILCRDRAFT_810933 [Piloderma croceum F 1598]